MSKRMNSTSPDDEVPMKRMCKSKDDCILNSNIKHYLTTDASYTGWGAKIDNLTISGKWPPVERTMNCTEKELNAILHAIRDNSQLLKSKTVLIQTDCRSSVTIVMSKGNTKSPGLRSLYTKIRQVLDQLDIKLLIHHIPGKYNYIADSLSRRETPPEWHILPLMTDIIFKMWGTPIIDLFASKSAHVVPKYCTLNREDNSAAVYDAFSIKWHFPLAWVFPPPDLIPKVLAHMNNASGIYLLVAPRCENMFWIPDVKSRALAPPLTIKNLSQVLIDTTTGYPPKRVYEIKLEIWKCAGGIGVQPLQENNYCFYGSV